MAAVRSHSVFMQQSIFYCLISTVVFFQQLTRCHLDHEEPMLR